MDNKGIMKEKNLYTCIKYLSIFRTNFIVYMYMYTVLLIEVLIELITNENENVIKKLCVFVHKAFIIRSHHTYVENV